MPRVLINKTSLSQTVDALNAAHFDGRTLVAAERGDAARWIAARQGLPGAYGGTFAGFPSERSGGIVLFTGERITSASAWLRCLQSSCVTGWKRMPVGRNAACAEASSTSRRRWLAGSGASRPS